MMPLRFSLLRLLCGLVAIVEETAKLSQGKYNAVPSFRSSVAFCRDSDNRIPETLQLQREAERAAEPEERADGPEWYLWGLKGSDWRGVLDVGSQRLIVFIVALAFFVALAQWGGAR